ncbi:mortality factor 4-like protein 1 [Nematocida major]|uniref:mortality factor 4-like protein 1 n=1 Tax=Nematocida major TaxID=1912982 RepID=UPI002007CBCF|nr:mortality factor 4-like protein 1 [Nematocida major]KAH9386953.1 mortality factor 4-like protein 1 [Nematocida major]
MLNEKTAKTILTEGKKVLVVTDSLKELGIILEKKDKPVGASSILTIYKVKTAGGQTKWVPSTALEAADSSVLEEGSELGAPWPKIELSEEYQELLMCEKAAMAAYKEPLPVEISADEIFSLFYSAQLEQKPHSIEEIKEVVKGFKEIFLYTVHTCILYKEERAFYEEYLYPKTTKILQTFGLTHVLRMLLVLHRVQASLGLSKEYIEYMGEYIKVFLQFLQTQQSHLLNPSAVAEEPAESESPERLATEEEPAEGEETA